MASLTTDDKETPRNLRPSCGLGRKPRTGEARTRRQICREVLFGSLLCSLANPWRGLLAAAGQTPAPYDLLVKGGRVIDPSQGLSAVRDVAVAGGRVARMARDLPESSARQVLDARGKIVTPGLIDVHVHVYEGVTPLGIPADPNCIARGVTTVLDAGSSGAHTFPGLRQHVINVVDTRVYALLNLSVVGQSTLSRDNPYGELLHLGYANPRLAVRTIEQNRDVILGIKVRLSRDIVGENDLKILGMAREAAEAVGLPVMVHIGDSHSPLPEILNGMGRGDVLTHTFHGRERGILDSRGRVLPEVAGAVQRGVHLDVGHGAGSFSFEVCEKALRQGITPGTISSDLHQWNVHGPVFDLATTLSKFLHLGLTPEDVIARATTNAAGAFGFPAGLGTLRQGATADIAVFALREGDFEFLDTLGQKRVGHRKLVPVASVKAGRIYGSASLPVPDRAGGPAGEFSLVRPCRGGSTALKRVTPPRREEEPALTQRKDPE